MPGATRCTSGGYKRMATGAVLRCDPCNPPNPCIDGGCPELKLCDYIWNIFANPLTPSGGRVCGDQWAGRFTGIGCIWGPVGGEDGGLVVSGVTLDSGASFVSYDNVTGITHMELYQLTSGALLWSGDSAPNGYTLFRTSGTTSSMTASIVLTCRTPASVDCVSCGPSPASITLDGTMTTVGGADCNETVPNNTYPLTQVGTDCNYKYDDGTYTIQVTRPGLNRRWFVVLAKAGLATLSEVFVAPGCVTDTICPPLGAWNAASDFFQNRTCVIA